MGSVISIPLPTCGVISDCLDYSAGQVVLGCNLEENVRTLKNEWDVLKRKKNDMQIRVNREEGPEIRRLHEVEGWMLRVTGMEVEIEELINKSWDEIDQTCSIGCCARSCNKRRKLEKKVTQKLEEVADLKSRGEFASVVQEIAPNPRAARNSVPTIGLEISFDEVWRHIGNDEVGIIGLYGMGGVGKTTLLTEINNKLSKETCGFDVVIWVTMSENSNIENIQHEIGKKIGYTTPKWRDKRRDEKAEDIFTVLSQKKFALLLDDIRVQFHLKDVGVPLPNTQNESKIILTTRSNDICGQMEAQKRVNVKCLGTDEAWTLFKSKVGDDTLNGHPEIMESAKLMARECGGLPLALILIGNVMAGKDTPQAWSHHLKTLKKNASRFKVIEDNVFGLLKLSYDNLPGDIERQCFLYCSLFPKDLYIPKQKLINYWISEEFMQDCYSFDEAKFKGYDIIGTLINACLLEEDGTNDGVKMHDVIREMALWLACDSGKTTGKYMVHARDGLTEVPSGIHQSQVERISLTGNIIEDLPESPRCHKLLTLLLNDNRLNQISQGFFVCMRDLRVLDLSGNKGITELPIDISLLVSIRYLNLSATGIIELPKELAGLKMLKYLVLTYMNHLHMIPDGLLSSFGHLKVLKMFGCGSSDLLTETSSFWGLQESLLREIEKMRYLDVLCITIRSSSYLIPFLASRGRCITRLGLSHLKLTDNILSQSMDLLKRLERLEITDCDFGRSYIYVDGYSSPNLRSLFIVRCLNFEMLIIHISGREATLKLLLVAYCTKIRNIDLDESASKLEEIYLIELPGLRSVYGIQKSQLLRYLGVEGCPDLRDLQVDSEELTIQGSVDWWNRLKHKPSASVYLTDSAEEKKAETSSSTFDPVTNLPNFKGKIKEFVPQTKDKRKAVTSSSTFDPDTYLPNFISFD